MKIKDGFILRKLPGMNLVMPTGKNVKTFNGSMVLNDTGAFIFEKLQKGATSEETAGALTQEYDVPLDTASADVQNTVASLIEATVWPRHDVAHGRDMGIEVTKRSVADWIALTQNREFCIPLTLHTTSGSMLPAIRMNVDTVVVVPCGAEDIRPGDIVLIRKPASPAGVLLHRLVRIRDSKLVTRGDNMPCSDGETDANSLLGRAISITGPGKSVDCDSCLRRLQGKVIVRTYPLRRILSLTRRACRKLVRLMLPHRLVDKIEREWKKTRTHE